MGHIRTGFLPKSRKWIEITQMITGMFESNIEIAEIAEKTIQNVRSQFRHIEQDNGVLSAFRFLVNIAFASREENPQQRLFELGIGLPDNPTVFSFAKAVSTYIDSNIDSCEYGEIARQAAGDAITYWYNDKQEHSQNLFNNTTDPFDIWRKAGDGSGFCELSRLFFANFTQRYLEYFLDRAASVTLTNIDQRTEFSRRLHEHVDKISLHAFETAKIAQSFAAGWFNNRIKEGIPNERKIKYFVSRSFGKIRDELQREESRL